MLDAAITTLKEDEKPLVHSDRGAHYRWPGWIERMTAADLTRSMFLAAEILATKTVAIRTNFAAE